MCSMLQLCMWQAGRACLKWRRLPSATLRLPNAAWRALRRRIMCLSLLLQPCALLLLLLLLRRVLLLMLRRVLLRRLLLHLRLLLWLLRLLRLLRSLIPCWKAVVMLQAQISGNPLALQPGEHYSQFSRQAASLQQAWQAALAAPEGPLHSAAQHYAAQHSSSSSSSSSTTGRPAGTHLVRQLPALRCVHNNALGILAQGPQA